MTDAHPSDSLADIRTILAEIAASQLQAQQRHAADMAEFRASQQQAQQRHDAEMAELRTSQQANLQASAERLNRIEAIQEETQTLQRENAAGITELRQSIADLRQENASAIAELRQENAIANEQLRQRIEQNSVANAELQRSIVSFRQENAEANAEMRREIKANIDDVSAMIFEGLEESKKLTDSNARAIQAWEQRLEAERDETITVEVDTLNAIQTLQSGQDGLRTDVQTLTHFVRDGFSTLSQAIVSLSQELSAQIQNLIDITRDNTGRITRLENEDHH